MVIIVIIISSSSYDHNNNDELIIGVLLSDSLCYLCADRAVVIIIIPIITIIIIVITTIIIFAIQAIAVSMCVAVQIADLAIGMMSIPPYIPYLLLGYWPASKAYCLFWLVWDYVTPAASTFNMCTISIDRYMTSLTFHIHAQ